MSRRSYHQLYRVRAGADVFLANEYIVTGLEHGVEPGPPGAAPPTR